MITKGIQREAKLAVNYVLKHFYSARVPRLSYAPPPERAGWTKFFRQAYDFDLIEFLCMSFTTTCSHAGGETAKIQIYIDGTLKDTIELPAAEGNNDVIIDCSSITGEVSMELRYWVPDTNESVFTTDITDLSFYPTLINPETQHD